MLQAVSQLAHAGENHSGLAESTSHLLESAPYVVLAWLVVVLAGHLSARYIFKLGLSGQMLTQAALHLLFGLYLHDKHNVLAAIIISLGFALILIQVVNSLSQQTATKPRAKKKKG